MRGPEKRLQRGNLSWDLKAEKEPATQITRRRKFLAQARRNSSAESLRWRGSWWNVHVSHLCPTLCDPLDCSPPGTSIHEIFQERALEWVSISSSRGSSWPKDQTHVSCVSFIADGFSTTEPLGTPWNLVNPDTKKGPASWAEWARQQNSVGREREGPTVWCLMGWSKKFPFYPLSHGKPLEDSNQEMTLSYLRLWR